MVAALAGHPGVGSCTRSLTHVQVRSLACSVPPGADLAIAAMTGTGAVRPNLARTARAGSSDLGRAATGSGVARAAMTGSGRT